MLLLGARRLFHKKDKSNKNNIFGVLWGRKGDIMVTKKGLFVAVLATCCLTATLFLMIPTSSQSSTRPYNPWGDLNDDGTIDIYDAIILSGIFGTSGIPITKASIQYDSGWVNVTDKCGQSFNITHNLNITDWNDPSIMVDITGKKTPDGQLLRFLGLTGQQGWNQTYGGTNYDVARASVQTGDGGYALAGWTESFGAGSYDFYLVKTDSIGNMQWNKTYGGTGDDGAFALVQTGDGGYALAGYTWSFGAGSSDAWLVKTDSIGNMQWNKTYGGTDYDEAFALVQTGDGGYALAGDTYSFGAGGDDAWLVKTDSIGNMQWNKTYGGTGDDRAFALVQTGDGGYALAGDTTSFGAGSYDAWLVKTDSIGNMQWNKTYGGTSWDEAFALVQTGDGGYALTGETESFGVGSADFYLVKTDSIGNMQWNKTYGGTDYDEALALVQTGDGGYALTGYTESFGVGSADFYLVKTDSIGNMQWNKTYGGTGDDVAFALVQTGDGGYALAGYTTSFGAGGANFWLVKTDAQSGLAWVGSSANSITLYRGDPDPNWNFVRVQIWKQK